MELLDLVQNRVKVEQVVIQYFHQLHQVVVVKVEICMDHHVVQLEPEEMEVLVVEQVVVSLTLLVEVEILHL